MKHANPVPSAPPDDRPLMPLPTAAAYLSIGLRTLKTLIAAKAIAVCRVSARRVAIHPRDLDAYVQGCRR
jgi:excisionase family DNA binding protein